MWWWNRNSNSDDYYIARSHKIFLFFYFFLSATHDHRNKQPLKQFQRRCSFFVCLMWGLFPWRLHCLEITSNLLLPFHARTTTTCDAFWGVSNIERVYYCTRRTFLSAKKAFSLFSFFLSFWRWVAAVAFCSSSVCLSVCLSHVQFPRGEVTVRVAPSQQWASFSLDHSLLGFASLHKSVLWVPHPTLPTFIPPCK